MLNIMHLLHNVLYFTLGSIQLILTSVDTVAYIEGFLSYLVAFFFILFPSPTLAFFGRTLKCEAGSTVTFGWSTERKLNFAAHHFGVVVHGK